MSASPRAHAQAAAKSAAVFAALGDETRLRLAVRLSDRGPASITALASGFAITRQAVTKHLRVMEAAGLVSAEPQGRETIWRLEPRPLDDARRSLDAIARQWDERLARLKRLVER